MAALKKILVVLLIILLAGGALVVWYAYLQRNVPAPGDSPISGLLDFFPFGRGGGTTPTPGGTEDGEGTEGSEGGERAVLQRLRLIASSPVAGATVFEDAKTKDVVIRYVDRATGHLFETTTTEGSVHRVTNTTIPKLQEAFFVESGGGVLLRYLKDDTDTIETFYGKVTPRTNAQEPTPDIEAELKGFFLPENIRQVAISPDTKKIFYLIENQRGSTGNVANPDGTGKVEIFSSPVAEWLVAWPEQRTLLLATKPASGVSGNAYFLNSSSGALENIASKINTLTALAHPSLRTLLYSEQVASKRLSLRLKTLATRSSLELPVATLPEKCVWGRVNSDVLYCAVPKEGIQGDYPDLWYQGVASFSDDLWKINTTTGEADVLFDLPEGAGHPIDVLQPFLDAREEFLFFTDKNDLSLWSLRLEE